MNIRSHTIHHDLFRVLFAGIAGFLLLWLAGCSTKLPYRTSAQPCVISNPPQDENRNYLWEKNNGTGQDCSGSWSVNVKKPVPFDVNFVEFDDQGVFVNRSQVESAIKNASAEESDGSYVVVFIHGWHHSAKSGDGHLLSFYDALASVSRWNKSRKIKGIYVGWRGDSLDLRYVNSLTFWDRKNTSDEVGRGAMLEFLLRLEREVKANKANKLVLIGHSFGASVAFNSLSHTFLSRFVGGLYEPNTTPRFRGYGDLVVLVNPAIEAMRFMPFQSALDYYTKPASPLVADFNQVTPPALVILSSQTDIPTRRLFPAGRFFSTFLEAHHRISDVESPDEWGKYAEWNMDVATVANFPDFHTHEAITKLELTADKTSIPKQSGAAGLSESCPTIALPEMRRLLNISTQSSENDYFPGSLVKTRRLERPGLFGSPYIIADVDKSLINGHNDIGGLNLICWVNQLLDAKDTEAPPVSNSPINASSDRSQ